MMVKNGGRKQYIEKSRCC